MQIDPNDSFLKNESLAQEQPEFKSLNVFEKLDVLKAD